MKKVKEFLLKYKKVVIIIAIVLVVIITFLNVTGGKRTDVTIKSFAISEDGQSITLNISVTGNDGYVRKAKVKKEDGDYYIKFYSTYGFNSELGSKDSFTIDLDSSCDKIYVYGEDGEYELVLKRNTSNNKWTLQ